MHHLSDFFICTGLQHFLVNGSLQTPTQIINTELILVADKFSAYRLRRIIWRPSKAATQDRSGVVVEKEFR